MAFSDCPKCWESCCVCPDGPMRQLQQENAELKKKVKELESKVHDTNKFIAWQDSQLATTKAQRDEAVEELNKLKLKYSEA